MATLSGLRSGFFTDIDVVDTISINGDSGTANQVLTSDGSKTSYQDPTLPAVSSLITAGTGITITSTGNPETIATNVKQLVLDGTAVSGAPETFNPNANGGSQTITINDTNTTYQGSATIDIDTSTDPDTISCLKVPNALTQGTNITFSSGTTYDGSSAITINSTDTNTEYTAGTGLDLTAEEFSTSASLIAGLDFSAITDDPSTISDGQLYRAEVSDGDGGTIPVLAIKQS